MPRVIVTVQVQDAAKWEAAFRTHGDLFRTMSLRGPIQYAIAGNEVTACMDTENLDNFTGVMESQATARARRFTAQEISN
jgi:hypothetical protein